MTVRVVVVSDTHLSEAAPHAAANWDAVVRYVAAASPDVVVHVGDISLDGASDPADLAHARRQLDRLPVAWHAVPGNHDVGDSPWPGASDHWTITTERRQRWLDIVGPDHWALELGGWLLVAVNAQLFGSGLVAEAAQWVWLEEQLRARRNRQPTALITHKPVTAPDAELAAAPAYRFVSASARRRLADLISEEPIALVISGHVHQYRVLDIHRTGHLWAPTTWAVLPDEIQPRLGRKRCGIVSIDLDGNRPPEPRLVEPEGLTQLMLLRDLPSPYRH